LNIGYLKQNQDELFPKESEFSTRPEDELNRLASNLGINRIGNWPAERLHNLSGGEKTKLALARILAVNPELLILDEPTNHLDYQGVEFLISELSRYQGTVIIISHDRYFLDRTVAKIGEISGGILRIYPGNYTAYREIREKERENQLHRYQSQQKEQQKIELAIKRLKNWSDKAHRESRKKAAGIKGGKEYYRKKAKKKDRAIKSQIKRLENMREEQVRSPEKEPSVNYILNHSSKIGRRLLEAKGITKTYGANRLFEDSSFYINRGEKVGIIGPNGCGKTTLLKTILGQESLDAGELFFSRALKAAYVSQEFTYDEEKSLKQLIERWHLEEQKTMFRLLISLGLDYNRFHIPTGNLSQGEKMKISTALAIMGEHDLLIFDEPNNHLDIFSRESLQKSLVAFPGSIILISHDRYLLEKVCNHWLVFANRKIVRMEGDLTSALSHSYNIGQMQKAETNFSSTEDRMLLETQIARVLSQLCLHQPGDPEYADLDEEYKNLLKIKRQLFK
ncbi:MAG: ABC-F family ATP-binding cassette domain-containing protein, partial [Syntrophomonadaceae bacterium]|nr:ABC-F family ATP-binding cassette domain-containing protein [Syntrophomonadaceae bacterium]